MNRLHVIILAIALVSTSVLSLVALPVQKPIELSYEDLSYEDAVKVAVDVYTPYSLDQSCAPIIKTHGKKADRSILLYHGYTNCPGQHSLLAEDLFNQGYNVYAPLMPYHGSEDKLTDIHKHITEQDLIAHVEDSLAIAEGIGESVTALGLSGGAIMAQIASQAASVEHVIAAAPSLYPKGYPSMFVKALPTVAFAIPNQMHFWRSEQVLDRDTGPVLAYKQFSTHSLGQYYRLGTRLELTEVSVGTKVDLVLVPQDKAISNVYAEKVFKRIEKKNDINLDISYIPEEWDLEHDIIDPSQPHARPDLVYPYLIELIAYTK